LGGLRGDVIDLVHGFDQFLGSSGNLFGSGADLSGGGGDLMGGALLLFGGGRDLGGGGVDLNARALDLAHEGAEVVGQPVEPLANYAKLILWLGLQALGEIALPHSFQSGDQTRQGPGNG
jgi:hypothetical protein